MEKDGELTKQDGELTKQDGELTKDTIAHCHGQAVECFL